MGAEFLLYGYGLVCLSMLVFNVLYSLHLRTDDRRLYRRMDRLHRQVDAQIRQLEAALRGNPPGRELPAVRVGHLTWLRRRLSRVSGLLAFDRLLDELQAERSEACALYLRQLQPVFLYLATAYLRRESTQAAYYCHFLARHQLQRHMELSPAQQVMLSYLRRESLYCKVNALKALCSFGSPSALTDALLELGRDGSTQLHTKVVTEALLTYTGEPAVLIRRLWDQLDRFSPPLQRAVLDYIRFQSGEFREPMETLLRDDGRDRELRFSAIRYFGRYPTPSVRELLLDFVRDRDPLRWEYAAISATALAQYPGQDVVDALLQALRSPNWYVRYNASSSLEAHGLTYEDLLQRVGGEDRYAREILRYRLETRRLAEPEAPAPARRREEAIV